MTTACAEPSPRPSVPPNEPRDPPPEIATLLGLAAVPGRRHDSQTLSLVLTLVGVFVITSPYLPLGLSLLEHLTLGTGQVEDVCRALEIHDDLERLYDATFFWLR